MNDAVYKFKRYEDASLSYTEINKHEDEDFGLYDTVITRTDAQKVFENIAVRELWVCLSIPPPQTQNPHISTQRPRARTPPTARASPPALRAR
jgi:hypothetical protein